MGSRVNSSTPLRLLLGALLLAASSALALSGSIASGQTPDDPSTQPIPTVERWESAQSLVLRVLFQSLTQVEFLSGGVSKAPPPARVGGPPLIGIEVFDLDGALLEEFSDWHPLWMDAHLADGSHQVVVQSSGEGRFVFAFAPDIGIVRITDIVLDQVLIEIDAHRTVVAYCAANPSDPGCDTVCIGDVDRDGAVTPQDIVAVARAMSSGPGDRRWNPDADINQDSIVGVIDLLLLFASQNC